MTVGSGLCIIHSPKSCLAFHYSLLCNITPAHVTPIAPVLEDTSKVVNLLKEVIVIASSQDIRATDSVTHLERLVRNLKGGKVRAGVVGLTKSGKSTFLNAILGRRYLPSSIEPQTAKEVIIIHTPDSPGKLVASEVDSDSEKTLAVGWEAINTKLTELNENARQGNAIIHRLLINTPILLLNEVDTIKLEISDTPGLYEAAAKNITYESELAVKEMSAFIMILNLGQLKTESEAAIINTMIQNHPALFEKLSRIIILVNAYDLAFLDDTDGSLKPSEISTYVADYLQNPDIIGIEISSEQIIPFSAKWALHARMWSADPAAFLTMKNANLLYEEAVILMQRAQYEGEIKPFDQATTEDVEIMCSFLLNFSHIEIIEEKLKTMLYESGPAILVEATVDDSIAEIATLLHLIEVNIESQNTYDKEKQFSCHEKLSAKFKEIESWQITEVYISTSNIDSITEGLRESLNSKFNSIFQNHLVGFHLHKDQNTVLSRIYEVKPQLTDPANAALRNSWNSVSSTVHQRLIEHSRNTIANLKNNVIASLTSFASNNPVCGALALKLSNQLSSKIDVINSNALVPSFPGLPFQVNGNSISNLHHIRQTYETELTTVKNRKRKATGLFNMFRKKVTYYSSVSHQAARFSPDITAVQNVLASEGTNPWTDKFRREVNSHVKSASDKLLQALKNAKINTLSTVKAELIRAVDDSRRVLNAGRDTTNRLTASEDKLKELQGQLKEIQSKF